MTQQMWKCRRCGEIVDMEKFKCGCPISPSPWEPIPTDEQIQNAASVAIDSYDKEGTYEDELRKLCGLKSDDAKCQCADECLFCGSHDHCSEAHPFKTLDDLIDSIPIGKHIPSGISSYNCARIKRDIKTAFCTYLRKLYEDSCGECHFTEWDGTPIDMKKL